ncbi:hypothetical protein [Caproicibacter sp.]|uniref:hypothetical protein n=1 Tax=Caproicibacter sp. TaxID=2814884 RepID=UPI0039897F26
MLIKDSGFSITPFAQINTKRNTGKTGTVQPSTSSFAGSLGQVSKTDKIELSSRAERQDAFLGGLKDSIREDIARDSGAAKLNYLKESVGNGSYKVDSGLLAGLLLFDE